MKLSRIIVFLSCSVALLAIAEALTLKTYEHRFDSFDDNTAQFDDDLSIQMNATISKTALQVTLDSASPNYILNLAGRVMLKKPFKLWDDDMSSNGSGRVASFNTSFLINIQRLNTTAAEGLTFLIAPSLNTPLNSSGEYLGLTNATIDSDKANQIVAVEFDTFQQDFDPDDNHVGLDINSVRSNKTEPLSSHNIQLASVDPRFYNIWIQYDGINKSIKVYIAEQDSNTAATPPMPNSPVLESDLDLRGVVNQDSYLGFSASTGNFVELNCVLRWNLTVNYYSEDKYPWLKVVLGAGVPVLVMMLLGAAGLGYYFHKKRGRSSVLHILGALRSLPGTPKEFKFKDLQKATCKFDEKNKLGQGGYGVVYRGMLPNEKLEIAVKWFSRESLKGRDDFLAELTIINRLRHKHLVRLLGWCHKNGKLLLVYDYMPNGSLDKHLFAGASREPLSWNLRHKIISGVASALHYLHNEYDERVVHRDIKASNIMLDSDFNARLGDFGLARVLDNEKTSYAEAEGVLGTVGYIAPECFHTGKATQQSDIYAFGAVLLEVVCGLRPWTKIAGFQSSVDWVWSLHREGHLLDAVDDKLADDFVPEEAERVLLLGLACSHPTASERPKMQEIVQILSGSLPVPYVPAFKPAFIWPAVMPTDFDTTSLRASHLDSGLSLQCVSKETYGSYTDDSLV